MFSINPREHSHKLDLSHADDVLLILLKHGARADDLKPLIQSTVQRDIRRAQPNWWEGIINGLSSFSHWSAGLALVHASRFAKGKVHIEFGIVRSC